VLRRGGPPGLTPLTAPETARLLSEGLEAGFDVFGDVGRSRIERLSRHGGWQLVMPDNPLAAVDLVRRLWATA
jgi:hypothetical protein